VDLHRPRQNAFAAGTWPGPRRGGYSASQSLSWIWGRGMGKSGMERVRDGKETEGKERTRVACINDSVTPIADHTACSCRIG